MARTTYAYPKLNRAGLGNLLFTWGRAEVFAARHRLPVIAPQWTSPKIGPLLRGEKDLRYYTGLFSARTYVRGLRRLWLLARAARIPEAQAEQFAAQTTRPAGSTLAVFEGMEGLFTPLHGHREFLHARLREILRPAVAARVTPLGEGPTIAVHIRHGDKFVVSDAARKPANFAYRIPDDWYVEVISNARSVLGADVPIVLFTDARAADIPRLLALPNLQMADGNPSVVDILRMARAQILVGTSTSTFGMWSAFLGGIPSIWYPAEHEFPLYPDKPGFQITAGLDGALPEGSAEVLRAAINP